MSWIITAKQYIPAVIGEPFGGGYFAGYISHTADGNPTHALIVAPKATGETTAFWKTSNTFTAGTISEYDGFANTAAIETAGISLHPATQFCANLSIGGYTDWYLPAEKEIEIAYFNLKPTSSANSVSHGSNNYSVPKRTTNYTDNFPTITTAANFANAGSQAFSTGFYWTSTQVSSAAALIIYFQSGAIITSSKTTSWTVRAFRRIAL